MPTNLPPEYFEVERRYKSAGSPTEKIACLEELITTIPKHKGTDKLRADLRKKLSKLKAGAQSKKGGTRHDSSYHIEREGGGRVVLVGAPNVGKSAMLAALTHATPKVSEYLFTTWTPSPGMMPVNNVKIQLIDTPALSREHFEPELLDLLRRSDLVLLILDLKAFPLQQFEDTVSILRENRIVRQGEIESAENNRLIQLPIILVANKDDDDRADEDFEALHELLEEWQVISVSAKNHRNLDELKQRIFEELNIIRVYSKPPGKDADFTDPFVLKKGGTVAEFASKVHRDFAANLKTARIWGKQVYDGQMVGRDHVLFDGDVVELHG